MFTNRYARAAAQAGAAILAVLLVFAVPSAAQAGPIIDALSPQARGAVDEIVRFSVVYDSCRGDWELEDAQLDQMVERLSGAITELPDYASLDRDGRKVLLLNLLLEMQVQARASPLPDCSVARIGGKRI